MHIESLLIPLLILVPNFFFFIKKPNIIPSFAEDKENVILFLFETAGRVGVFILPMFYRMSFGSLYKHIALSGMVIMLIVYYICWIIFYKNNREYKLLYSKLFNIPVPMAISPIIYFILSSVILDSFLILAAAVILGIGHIPLSYEKYKKTKEILE